MRAFCREKGIVFQALSVLGHFWVDLPEYELNENPLLGHVVLENIAKEHMSTPASVRKKTVCLSACLHTSIRLSVSLSVHLLIVLS